MINSELNLTGKVLGFTYSGGSRPGQYRVVYCREQIGKDTMRCWDFAANGERLYRYDPISDFEIIEEGVQKLNVQTLPASMADADDIVDAFDDENKYLYHDLSTNTIIAVEPDVVHNVSDADAYSVKIHDHNNHYLITFLTPDKEIKFKLLYGQDRFIGLDNEQLTLSDLATMLLVD